MNITGSVTYDAGTARRVFITWYLDDGPILNDGKFKVVRVGCDTNFGEIRHSRATVFVRDADVNGKVSRRSSVPAHSLNGELVDTEEYNAIIAACGITLPDNVEQAIAILRSAREPMGGQGLTCSTDPTSVVEVEPTGNTTAKESAPEPFADPKFSCPTNLSLIEMPDGWPMIFGHLVLWDQVPWSRVAGWSWFLKDVGTGPICWGYDKSEVAVVALGVDDFGIWYSGLVLPDVLPERLVGGIVSGAWNSAGGLTDITIWTSGAPGPVFKVKVDPGPPA